MYIAISAAGAFRSEDGGETWEPANQGVAADFFPDNPFPEVGHCVHKLLVHPGRPERLWQQNHCGVYRSDDHGRSWERLEGNGLPSGFGFPIALDPSNPDIAFVIPEEGAENRVTNGRALGVYRTRDGGASWELAANGLPHPAWCAVLREASSFDEDGVYFGTQSGSVFVTKTGGESWFEAASQLPPILSGRGGRLAVVLLPGMLAAEVGGQRRFEVEADTVASALRSLPVANLVFDERGALRQLVNVYVDGVDVRDAGGIDRPLSGSEEIRLVGAIAGG